MAWGRKKKKISTQNPIPSWQYSSRTKVKPRYSQVKKKENKKIDCQHTYLKKAAEEQHVPRRWRIAAPRVQRRWKNTAKPPWAERTLPSRHEQKERSQAATSLRRDSHWLQFSREHECCLGAHESSRRRSGGCCERGRQRTLWTSLRKKGHRKNR